jgi:peptidyl-prolyl cis-trans isomerase SurA
MKLHLFLITVSLFCNSVFSQNDEVLFTVNNTKVTTNEFLRIYNKNLELVQNEDQKDIDEYLKLFINYKLKLEEAYDLGFDNDKKYANELKSYRNKLSKKYLTDTKINDNLLKEAYERTVYEVNVNHILIKVDEDASPEDSLKAYNKVLEYKKNALKDGFENTMSNANDGKVVFGESLGYFSAFKMVYDFENIAYTTNVGEISDPFRTKFGFHILNVVDKRKSQGEVTVAHIMVANENDKITTSPKKRIYEIWEKVNDGNSFSDLAKQFSDDKNSARKGGQITRFGSGELSSLEFEKVAFSLDNVGDVSKPIQTKYGWHIIKLIKKHNIKSFKDQKIILEQKIKKDSRSKIVNDNFYNALRNRYNFSEVIGAEQEILKIVDSEFIIGNWNPSNTIYNNTLATFANEKISYLEYYKYLSSKIRSYKGLASTEKIVSVSYNDFINARIYNYHKENLEFEYPEFKNIVQEYSEGLLLFKLMDKEVWEKSKKDTTGLRNFYNNNKEKYLWNKRIEAIVVTCENKQTAKKIRKQLKSNITIEKLKNMEINPVFSEGLYELSDKEFPDKYEPHLGVSKVFKHNNQFVVVKGLKEVLPKQKSFDEVKGKVINDYQSKIENDFMIYLSKKYKVVINQNTLKSLKKSL